MLRNMKRITVKRTLSLLLILMLVMVGAVSVASADTGDEHTEKMLAQSGESASQSGATVLAPTGGMSAPVWLVVLIAVLSCLVAGECIQLSKYRNQDREVI